MMSQYGNIHFYSGARTQLSIDDFLRRAAALVGSDSVWSATCFVPPKKYDAEKYMHAYAQGRSIKPPLPLADVPGALLPKESVHLGMANPTLPSTIKELLSQVASPTLRGNFRPDYASLSWGRSFVVLNSAENQDFDVVAEPDWDISISGWGMSENPKAFEREVLTHPDFVAIVDRIAAELGPTKVCADWTY